MNVYLRQERIRRNWRQRDLAEELGTTVVTVKRWERGYQQPGAYFRVKLCTLFGRSAEELGLVSDASPEEATLWSVPFSRNPFFTGRDFVLEQLHTVLTNNSTIAALTQSYALHGLGGIGKTQLAIEYVYRHRCEYHAVFWVEAETHTSLTSSFIRLATVLELPEKTEEDQSKIVAAVLRWLNRHEEWLLIFDNVEDLALIKPFLPSSDQGAFLLTTRLQTLGTLALRIDLPPMNMQEGSDFLLVRTNRQECTAIGQQEHAATRAIITEMGGLPLALEQAGAYIDAAQCSLSDYLHLFQQMRHHLLNEHEPSSDHPLSVTRTFLLAFEQVEQRNPLAAELLTACAFLAPEAIPETFFLEGASSLGPGFEAMATDPLAFPEAIKVLLSYSLLQRSALTRTITVHRLVQAVLKARLTDAEQRTWGRRVIEALGRLFPAGEETQTICLLIGEQLVAHAQACLSLADQWYEGEAFHVPLMSHVAAYLSKRVRYAEAEPLFGHARQIGERLLGAGHPMVAEVLHGLADLFREQGKYTEAEALFERALCIREQTLAPLHPLIATSLDLLGYCYYQQGKYEQAEPLLQRALYVREQVLDSEHPQVASSLLSLGTFYRQQSKYEQAEPFLLRALHIWEQALGSEHPDVAHSLNGLGILYDEQGKYQQAEDCYQHALRIGEQMLGPEHPDVATYLNNLGELYYQQGKYEQAEDCYQRALRIWEQALGPEHPDVAYPLNGLANLSREQGKYEQAKLLYQRALTLRQQYLSPLHPDIAENLHDLARFHHLQLQTTEALALYQQARVIREQVHGLQHPKTAETRNAIMRLLQGVS